MRGFDLPENYIDNPELVLRRTRAKLKRISTFTPEDQVIKGRCLSLEFEAMGERSLREFSAPTTANIRTEPNVNIGDNGFELKPGLINMVQANQFSGKAHEDASTHLQTLFGDF